VRHNHPHGLCGPLAVRQPPSWRVPFKGSDMNKTTHPPVDVCSVKPIGPDFDQHDPAFGRCAYETLDASREAVQVSRSEVYGGFWVVTRHEDAKAVAHNPTVFSNSKGVVFPEYPGGTAEMMSITLDPPELVPYRKLLAPLFSPRTVGERSKVTDEICNYLIDQFVETGEADFYQEYASPLAAIVTLRFLGMDGTEWEKYTKLSHILSEKGWLSKLSEEDQASIIPEFVTGLQAFFEHTVTKIKEAEAKPPHERGESIIDNIADAEIGGEKLSYETLTNIVNTIFQAGFDTTAMALGAMMYRLGQDHGMQQLLRGNPDRIESFVEESLRIQSPTTLMLKVATQDVVLGNAEIKKGDPVLISWAAANRDPREFDNPTVFDMDRSPNRHSSFGLGVHRCLGAHIARSTLLIGVTEILRRLPHFQIDPDRAVHSETCGIVFGYRKVPGTFTPGHPEHCYPDDVLSGPW
jgi:cytochrome P450